MGRKPKVKTSLPRPADDAAFYPRTVGRLLYVFRDGVLEWVPEDRAKGRFCVTIAEQEVREEGFQAVPCVRGPMTAGSQPPRWGRITGFHRISSRRVVGCFGRLPNRKRAFFRFASVPLGPAEFSVGKGVVIFETEEAAAAAGFRPSKRVLSPKVTRWSKPYDGGFHPVLTNETPGQLASGMLRTLPSFPVDASFADPHRVAWWIREGGCLKRVKSPPSSRSRIVAVVYHFCTAPGAFIRVEIVEPFTVESWQQLREAQRPKTFPEQLDLMAEHLKAFGEPQMHLHDPSMPEDRGFRPNPKWEWWNGAGLALQQVKRLVEWTEEGETRESIRLRMEEAARQAYLLGANMTLLEISPKVPVLRRREKMDQRTGRPKAYPKLKDAVRAFVKQNPGAKKSVILKRLKRAAKTGACQIHFIEERNVYAHEAEEKPEWKESTMAKEIAFALAELHGEPGKPRAAKNVSMPRGDAKKTGRK